MKNIFVCLLFLGLFACEEKEKSDFTTVFETSKGLETATYKQVIDFHTNLS